MAFTFQGIGTTFYGQRDFGMDGSYITTEWVVFLFIPVIPLRSLRVRPDGGESIGIIYQKENYAVFEKNPPNWKQVLSVYLYVGLYLFWCVGLLSNGNSIESFLRRWFSYETSGYLLATICILGIAVPAVIPFVLRWYARKNLQ